MTRDKSSLFLVTVHTQGAIRGEFDPGIMTLVCEQ